MRQRVKRGGCGCWPRVALARSSVWLALRLMRKPTNPSKPAKPINSPRTPTSPKISSRRRISLCRFGMRPYRCEALSGTKTMFCSAAARKKGAPISRTGWMPHSCACSTVVPSFFFMVMGDDTRYWAHVGSRAFSTLGRITVENEDDAVAVAQYRWNPQQELATDVFLGDTFIKTRSSTSPPEPGALSTEAAVPTVGNNLTFRPSLRRDFTSNLWVEMEWRVARQWFGAPLYTYWMTGGHLTLGCTLGPSDALNLSYEADRILYDSETTATANGVSIPGSPLRVWEQEAEVRYTHYFDKAQHWSAVSRAGIVYDSDNGSGFFNSLQLAVLGKTSPGKKAPGNARHRPVIGGSASRWNMSEQRPTSNSNGTF